MSILESSYQRVIRPALFRLDAEKAHERTIQMVAGLGSHPISRLAVARVCGRPATPVQVAGIDFPGIVGLAAGADKDGVAARGWASLGFGFVELGTVTAKAQPGNPRPRSFRLKESRAVINRMGFNNEGAAALATRLAGWGVRRGKQSLGIPLGISLGKSKVTPLVSAVDDYVTSLETICSFADYVAINVSSPNTPGLRELQNKDFLSELTSTLVARSGGVPIFVKIAPDVTDAELDDIVMVAESTGVSGLILTNTTLHREGLALADIRKYSKEAGGLSGAPLTVRSREMVRSVASRTALPIMGTGGILTSDDAQAMLDAGASLVQIYTGLIYQGPELVRSINESVMPQAVSPNPVR